MYVLELDWSAKYSNSFGTGLWADFFKNKVIVQLDIPEYGVESHIMV